MLGKLFKRKKDSVNNDDEFTAEAMARTSEVMKSNDLTFMKRDVKRYIEYEVRTSANIGRRKVTVSYTGFLFGYTSGCFGSLSKDTIADEIYEECKRLSVRGFVIEKDGENITIRW